MCTLVTDFDFHVFGASETCLDPSKIEGYTMERADRSSGGGPLADRLQVTGEISEQVMLDGESLEQRSFIHRSRDFCLPARYGEVKGAESDQILTTSGC
ncbi:hypothetical protein J6590_075121 [Homalodisca vitripennis]|nr:hypothetical protein J6590_075121 [Homalodisca vitripennis]